MWGLLEKAWQINLSPFVLFFNFKWRSACMHQFHSLGQDQSTVAKQTETAVDDEHSIPWWVACEFVSLIANRFANYAWTALSSTLSSLVQGCTCSSVTSHLLFWHHDWDLLGVTVAIHEWNGEWLIKSQHRKFIALEKKILPLLPPGFEPTTFWSWVWHSTNWDIPG